jgi:hypothetical protein
MLAIRLVQLVEDHADRLSEGLLRKLKSCEACSELLCRVPPHELKNRTYEIYRNLGDWVLNKTDSEIEERYLGLGARRARQGVPFSQFLYAIQTTKEHLWEFLHEEGFLEPRELVAEMDLLRSVERFFDLALYFAATGYETKRQSELLGASLAHAASEK